MVASNSTSDANKAAATIQNKYRSFRERRQDAGFTLAKSRWQPLLNATELVMNNLQYEGAVVSEGTKQQWVRATTSAARVGKGSSFANGDDALLLKKEHWLEATDSRHRYGSNLRPYHEYWLSQPTTEPFFYWLDHGQGRDLDLDTRPRARLDSQQLHYCSAAERHQLEAELDAEGLLRYRHSGELVHTLSADEEREMHEDFEAWKQADVAAAVLSRTPCDSSADASPAGGAAAPSAEELKAAKQRRNANKWIFVTSADGNRFYVAPKVKGRFQHSSFLAGGAVGAAGAIMVNRGRIVKLTPMSGHYVPDVHQYIAFLDKLAKQKVDLTRALLLNPFPPQEGCRYHMVQVDRADVDDHTE
ncbi:hypothetical protein WJX72_004631 [[Myrmecia] bisecta]|uniref:Uncharacterized protein n=1 Tax=[Myrmecia] bisecta TaxID=41462 RepID=A0AAW1PSN7_9CHLO